MHSYFWITTQSWAKARKGRELAEVNRGKGKKAEVMGE